MNAEWAGGSDIGLLLELFEAPAEDDVGGHQDGSDGQAQTFCKEVHEVEESETEGLELGDRTCAEGHGEYQGEQILRDDYHGARLFTAPVETVSQVGDQGFGTAQNGGEAGKVYADHEQAAEDVAEASHLVEEMRQGDEDQGRTGGRLDSVGEQSRYDQKSGQNRYEGVQNGGQRQGLDQVGPFVQIASVYEGAGHADADGEEHLGGGGGDHVKIDLGEVRRDVPQQAFAGAWQGVGVDGQGDHDDEQGRQQYGADLFHALFDA